MTTGDLASLLGEIAPIYIERILETGATLAEASEALASLEYEQRTGECRVPSTSRVTTVMTILDEMLEGEREGERGDARRT